MDEKDTIYQKIERCLFKDRNDAHTLLTRREEAVKNRMMLCVAKKMDDPLVEDAEIVNFLMHGCGGSEDPVSKSQAYRDVAMMNRLLGNVQLAAKSWYRYMIIEGCKKGYQIAMDNNDAKGMAACLDKIGKYTMADKEDNTMNFEQMVPPSFEPSDDVTLMEGITPIDNLEERRKELRRLARNMVMGAADDAQVVAENTDEMDENEEGGGA